MSGDHNMYCSANQQTDAMRLADALQQQAVWEGHYGPSYLRDLLPEAADELRHLSAINAQLLEALVRLLTDEDYPEAERQARAAIAVARSSDETSR